MAISDFFGWIDPPTMILGACFLIIFAFLMFALGRTKLRENHAVMSIIALSISLLSTYGITKTNFDPSELVYNLGISDEQIYIAVPILFLMFLVLIGLRKDPATGRRKFSLGRMLIILGVIALGISFTGLIYRKVALIFIGAGLILLGIIISNRRKIRFKKKII